MWVVGAVVGGVGYRISWERMVFGNHVRDGKKYCHYETLCFALLFTLSKF